MYIAGTLVLNAPVGLSQFCERKFTEKVRSFETVLDDFADLENVHVSFTLRKFCIGVCKVKYQLRVTPPESIFTGAKLFDGLIEKCLRWILGDTWDTAVFEEMCPIFPILLLRLDFEMVWYRERAESNQEGMA